MKINIKPFIKRLIKDNIFYIVGNIFLVVLIIVTINIGISEINNYKNKISKLQTENIQLMNKVTLMNSKIPQTAILDQDIKFLNTLIPNAEDYFSIIYSLEKISQKSGFVITEYTVSIDKSTTEKLRLSVSGVGDSQSFLSFLRNYNFGGGRLITSDKVSLDPSFSGALKVDLTFYNKKTASATTLTDSPDTSIYQGLENLKIKVNFDSETPTVVETPPLDYPKKDSLF